MDASIYIKGFSLYRVRRTRYFQILFPDHSGHILGSQHFGIGVPAKAFFDRTLALCMTIVGNNETSTNAIQAWTAKGNVAVNTDVKVSYLKNTRKNDPSHKKLCTCSPLGRQISLVMMMKL